MIDGIGRNIDYVRISLTDRCNLRCVYCMPEEGVCAVPHEEVLSFEEILRLARMFASLGIHKIKLTGGEPLVRKNIARLVKDLKSIDGITQVTLTTNGILLEEHMEALHQAGIDGINISLDTMEAEVYAQITRRDLFEKAMTGFQAALKYPDIPLKINCVPMGMEGQKIVALAELARLYPVHVRYIEMMPIGLGKAFDFLSEAEILKELEAQYGAYEVCEEALGNGPGHYYTFAGFRGRIGFISAISHKFCASCNRVRLTSQGYLKACLQYDIGTDVKALLRKGVSEEEICSVIKETIFRKPVGHQFQRKIEAHEETHTMAQIGG